MQIAFETLREKFANIIHLIQPDERLPYIIQTDASCSMAIGAVLMQKDPEGNVNIVSTASRVMNSAGKRYTCEQELLAIVYALEKLIVHVDGNKIFVNNHNRDLIFPQ